MDKKSVLIVDDQEIILKAVGRFLELKLKCQISTINSTKNDFGINLESLVDGIKIISNRMGNPYLVIDYTMESEDGSKFTGIDILRYLDLNIYKKIILYTADNLNLFSNKDTKFMEENRIVYVNKLDQNLLLTELLG